MRKRMVALLLMILMICSGVLIGTRKSLDELKNKTDKSFINGVENDGYSIQNDLEQITADSYNLYTVAKNYLTESDSFITGLLASRDALSDARTPSEKFIANEKLLEAVTALYYKIKEAEMTETHSKLAAQFYTQILSCNSTIKNNSYNDEVRKYNSILESFPTRFVAPLIGVKPAELFATLSPAND